MSSLKSDKIGDKDSNAVHMDLEVNQPVVESKLNPILIDSEEDEVVEQMPIDFKPVIDANGSVVQTSAQKTIPLTDPRLTISVNSFGLSKEQSNEELSDLSLLLSQMSLIKVQSKEDNYRRDSFSDRVCDDLSEVILQYLSLKDRLRLECVSKQFQRTALNSKCDDYLDVTSFDDRLDSLEQLFKKCPKINKISFDLQIISNDLIELIINYCKHLTHIRFIRFDVEEDVKKRFFDKFGHNLISLIYSGEDFDLTFTNTPNIEELAVSSIGSQLSQMKFIRLKWFYVELSAEDLDQFEVFIENNAKTLRHLNLNCEDIEENVALEHLFKIISKSRNLVHLSIYISYGITGQLMAQCLREIQINCKQIKSLRITPKDNSIELISILKKFKRLKRLDLGFYDKPSRDNFQPFRDFKGLEGLTHLSIDVMVDEEEEEYSDILLIDINLNFPKLRSLIIDIPFMASDLTAQVLCQLSSLETIKLKIKPEFKSRIKRQLIKSCKKFKCFEVI